MDAMYPLPVSTMRDTIPSKFHRMRNRRGWAAVIEQNRTKRSTEAADFGGFQMINQMPPLGYRECSAHTVMTYSLLLTVEDSFLINGRGLVVVPPIDLPLEPLRFKPFSDELRIERPDGTEMQALVKFAIEHLSLVGGGSTWHITAMIPSETKESIPIGSRLFAHEETMKKLKGIYTPPKIE
jgi:hypothetical protein